MSSPPDAPDPKRDEWDLAYSKGQNWLFWPNEELVRFVSRRVRRRTDLGRTTPILDLPEADRFLDVGCGIGRHLVFGAELGLDVAGIDLSAKAIEFARRWLGSIGVDDTARRVLQGDVRRLPWPDNQFGVVVSHAVFDSMPFEIARAGFAEVRRVMAPNALFYCDLISGDPRDEVVSSEHEAGTIQSWYDLARIHELIDGIFAIDDGTLVSRTSAVGEHLDARWHTVLTALA